MPNGKKICSNTLLGLFLSIVQFGLNRDYHFPISLWIVCFLALLAAEPNPNLKKYLNIVRTTAGETFLICLVTTVTGQRALESM